MDPDVARNPREVWHTTHLNASFHWLDNQLSNEALTCSDLKLLLFNFRAIYIYMYSSVNSYIRIVIITMFKILYRCHKLINIK